MRCFIAFATLLAAAPLAAQDAPATLTFREALDIARQRNPVYRRALNAVETADLTANQRRGALLPRADASLSFRGNNTRSFTALDEFGEPVEGFVETTSSSASQSVFASVDLFNWANIQSWRAAQAETDASEASAAFQAAQLRTRVGVAYYDAVRAQQRITLEERRLEIAETQLEAIRELLRVAARQPTDVLGAEVDVATQEQELQRVRGEARKAMLSLQNELGVEGATDWALEEDFPPLFDPSGLDPDLLVEEASGSAPRVREAVARVDAADRSVGAARSARFPTVSLGGSVSRGDSRRDYAALFEMDPQNRALGFSISASLPLFSGLQTSAAIAQAEVRADDAREQLREARLQVGTEVRSALIDLENAHRAVELAERAHELAQQRLELGQEEYRQNSIDFTQLQTMVQQAAQAERSLLEARYNFLVARLTLEERVGRELR